MPPPETPLPAPRSSGTQAALPGVSPTWSTSSIRPLSCWAAGYRSSRTSIGNCPRCWRPTSWRAIELSASSRHAGATPAVCVAPPGCGRKRVPGMGEWVALKPLGGGEHRGAVLLGLVTFAWFVKADLGEFSLDCELAIIDEQLAADAVF